MAYGAARRDVRDASRAPRGDGKTPPVATRIARRRSISGAVPNGNGAALLRLACHATTKRPASGMAHDDGGSSRLVDDRGIRPRRTLYRLVQPRPVRLPTRDWLAPRDGLLALLRASAGEGVLLAPASRQEPRLPAVAYPAGERRAVKTRPAVLTRVPQEPSGSLRAGGR